MKILILGTRGIPAQHGGFETFAEGLSTFLVACGYRVTVYCQVDETPSSRIDTWEGIERVNIQSSSSAWGTVVFDAKAVWDSLWRDGAVLTLGYNTAIFSIAYVLTGRKSVMNMDGLEWKRDKWSRLQRYWLRLNEYAGAKLSTKLIADHPMIEEHLRRIVRKEKITMIPYGATVVDSSSETEAAEFAECTKNLPLQLDRYAIVIARPEPENSLLEIVTAFSRRKRDLKLVVLGLLTPETNAYHRQVLEAASPEVLFPGAIYDKRCVRILRLHARVYIHGHTVGGTNPSLIEAMAAGSAVIARDNVFNRWVASPESLYFSDVESLASLFDSCLDDEHRLSAMRERSRHRHSEGFDQETIFMKYKELLDSLDETLHRQTASH